MSGMFTVYGLHLDDDPKVRYVGITVRDLQDRFSDHLETVSKEDYSPKACWIRKHGADKIRCRPLELLDNVEDLKHAEKSWIFALDTYVYDKRGGLNATRGGDGTWGYKWSDEARTKHAAARALQVSLKGESHPLHGKPFSTLAQEAATAVKRTPKGRETLAKNGAIGNHNRWHVARQITKPDCIHCGG